MIKRTIAVLLGCWITTAQSQITISEQQLLQEFENNFEHAVSCNQDFFKCAQEKKTAKEKYLAENKHRIRKSNHDKPKQEVLNEYNHRKKQREIVTREGSSFKQVIIKEEPQKSISQRTAEGLIGKAHQIMQIDKITSQWQKNVSDNSSDAIRKLREKYELCSYWKNNQNKHPQGKQMKEQACK